MKDRTNPSAAASVNLSELLARVDNDRELLFDLLSIFKEEFPAYLKTLGQAVARSRCCRERQRQSHPEGYAVKSGCLPKT
jgi:hypothetical protein